MTPPQKSLQPRAEQRSGFTPRVVLYAEKTWAEECSSEE